MGLKSASTVANALYARSAVGQESASTVVGAVTARSAVGHRYASTVVSAISARSAVGHQSASTVVGALSARSASEIVIDSQNNKPKIHNHAAANNYLYTTPRNPARTSPHPDNIPIAVIPESAHLARPITASTNAASGICMLSPTLAMVGEVSSTARAHR